MAGDETDSSYGWLIVGVSFCSMIFTWGTTFSFGVFLDPLVTEFGYSSVRLSTAFSVELLAFYGLAGVVGILFSKIAIRPATIALSVVLGAIAVWFLQVQSYLGLVVIFSVMGTILGTMYVVLVSVVPQWFERREGLAMGIIFAGNGLGVQILPPVWEWAIGAVGLRTAFLWLTLLTAAVFFVTGLVVRRPRNVGSAADEVTADLGRWLVSLARNRRFWIAFVGAGLLFAWYYMISTHAISLFTGRGFSRSQAAFLFGLIGGISVVTRLLSGYLADRIGSRPTIVGAAVAAGIGFFFILVDWNAMLYLAILCFGLGLGAAAPLYIPAMMQSFQPEHETAFVGVVNFVYAIFAFAIPFTSSVGIRLTGGYSLPFVTMGLLTIGGAGIFWVGTR